MTIYPNKIKELPADKQAAIKHLLEEAANVDKKQISGNPTFSVKYNDYLVVGKWRLFGGGNETLNGIAEIIGWEWFEIVKCKKQ